MFNTPNCMPSAEVIRQLEKKRADNQKVADAAELALQLTVEEMALHLYQTIVDYQLKLPDKDDVTMKIVNFGTSTTIYVDNIWCIGNSLIVFHGADTSGKPLELIQHMSQLNFLLACQPKDDQNMPKRQIGFGER